MVESNHVLLVEIYGNTKQEPVYGNDCVEQGTEIY